MYIFLYCDPQQTLVSFCLPLNSLKVNYVVFEMDCLHIPCLMIILRILTAILRSDSSCLTYTLGDWHAHYSHAVWDLWNNCCSLSLGLCIVSLHSHFWKCMCIAKLVLDQHSTDSVSNCMIQVKLIPTLIGEVLLY